MSMPVVLKVARNGSRTGSHEHDQGSESANLTGRSEAAHQYGEMKRQTAGLLICIRSCVPLHTPPGGVQGIDLPDSARWFVATLQLFLSILPEPQPSLIYRLNCTELEATSRICAARFIGELRLRKNIA
jgi:hypothetical protein